MKHVLKKSLATTLAVAALVGFTAFNADAAYSLSDEVKSATPALVEATSIGVLSHENPAMMLHEDKDALVVMSFGTTFKDTREKTINATVKEIEMANPNTKVVVAFTSHIIIDRIAKNEGLKYPTPEEALMKLKEEGYTRVALTSLNIIPGIEYKYGVGVFHRHKNDFKKMTLGVPLMYWMGQEEQRDDVEEAMKAFSTQFPKVDGKHATLLMAHGTPDPSNAYYSVMQNRINDLGLKNTYIYSVEGWPHLDTIIPQLKAKGIKHVTLMPMMMVAGDHANNDMAGDEPDSHKSILMEEGFTVDAYLHGMGENEAIRHIFKDRANEALEELRK